MALQWKFNHKLQYQQLFIVIFSFALAFLTGLQWTPKTLSLLFHFHLYFHLNKDQFAAERGIHMGWVTQSPVRSFNVKSKRSRAAMPISTNPVYVGLEQRGLSLGYRKNAKDGSWSFRRYANGRYEYHVPDAVADDERDANGETALSYQQAVAAAIKWNEQQARQRLNFICSPCLVYESSYAISFSFIS